MIPVQYLYLVPGTVQHHTVQYGTLFFAFNGRNIGTGWNNFTVRTTVIKRTV